MADPAHKGMFHSFSLGRARPTSSKPPSEALAHPLLAASSSSLSVHESGAAPSQPDVGPSRSVSASGDVLNVPYKPRQRGIHGPTNSVSSISSVTATTSTAPNPLPSGSTTSPVTPAGVPAPPTTSTSTSTTFALPQSAETISDVSNPSSPTGTATSRLQLQSLKATAQKIGLGNGSMGMALLDAIFEKSQMGKVKGDGAEWAEVLKLLSSGKAVLFLPTSSASSLSINCQSLRDHVAFLSPPIPVSLSESGTPGNGDSANVLVTLSGLVGAVQNNAVTFESTLPADSSIALSLKDSATRSATLSALRPSSIVTPAFSHYPSFELSPEATSLPFPPINKGTSHDDGRDAGKGASGSKRGRINPFASFFSPNTGSTSTLGSSPGSQSVASPASPSKRSVSISTPERPRSPSPRTVSPRPSISNLDSEVASIRSDATIRDPEGYQVAAYTISKPIRFADVNKALPKAIKAAIKDDLNRLPEKVLDRVYKIVVAGACPTYSSSSDSKSDALVIPQFDFTDPSSSGEKLQDFVESVYDDLLIHYQADSSHIFAENSDFASMRRKTSWTLKAQSGESVEVDSEDARKERKEKQRRERDAKAEQNATVATDRVEAVICRMLYNRLFSPLESDDSRHDEALASRIAALNLLDLSLDHLGLITRPTDVPPEEDGLIAKGLAEIVERVGSELQKLSLPTCLTPKDKADALIKAHKIVVEGLMKLPPIDLRPEDEPYKPDPSISSRPASPSGSITAVKPVTSSSSIPDIVVEDKDPKPKASSSAEMTPLSVSPPSADPLASIAEVSETTPHALQSTAPTSVPELALPEANEASEASQIEQAMSDSVIDTPEPVKESSSPAYVDEEKKPARSGTSGADLILPIIIYAVVKANPPQLASQLMYLRRYRSAICLTGEASYAIVNLTAVVEFLEHVELSQLGLGDSSGKVMSVADLSPISLNYLDASNADAASIASASSRLRGRVFQVGELAGSAADSANRVITGVVDSSWMALRGLISAPSSAQASGDDDDAGSIHSASGSRPVMRPRQASSFSLASVTASVATIAAAAAHRSRSRANSRASAVTNAQKDELHTWKGNEEMVEVTSRPASVRDRGVHVSDYPSSDEESEADHYDRRESLQKDDQLGRGSGDKELAEIRSNKSSTSLASPSEGQEKVQEKGQEKGQEKEKDRSSLSNRLASIGAFRSSTPSSSGEGAPSIGILSGITSARHGTGTGSAGHSRRVSLLGGVAGERAASIRADSSPVPSLSSLPLIVDHSVNEPPNEHFMTCDVGDLRLSEVGELLRDYRRLGLIVQSLSHNK